MTDIEMSYYRMLDDWYCEATSKYYKLTDQIEALPKDTDIIERCILTQQIFACESVLYHINKIFDVVFPIND